MTNIKWKLRGFDNKREVMDNDIRIVELPVRCLFEWSDKIIKDYDHDTNTVLEYRSGFIMKVGPNQDFVYDKDRHDNTTFIGSTIKDI